MKTTQYCVSRRVEVKTRDQLRSEHCVVIVQELIKHLLYMRNQIPGLFEDLEWQIQAQEQEKDFQVETARLALLEHTSQQGAALTGGIKQLPRRKRRLQTSQKRLTKFMHSAKVLLDSIAPQLFTAQQPMHAFIVFGSTASRPSELYSLAFPATDQQFGGTPQKAMGDLARRTIRALVMNTQDMPEGKASAGPTKMFMLACSSLQEESIPAGFLYKRGFQIRMKKGIQVHIDLTGAAQPDDMEATGGILPSTLGSQDNLHWYQCKMVLKGLRSPGGGEVDRAG
ncbi:hypothetical protein ABBQ38_013531 [Trebouxia sp. C0009 RCD-2024]